MTIQISIPKGRGKAKIERPWSKTVTSVAKNATTGRDYEGEWLTYGTTIEAEPGDIIAVQDADGDGCCLYVLDPGYLGLDPEGRPQRRAKWWVVEEASGKNWAGECAIVVRTWLALDVAGRLALAASERTDQIRQRLAEWRADENKAPKSHPENNGPMRDRAWWIAAYEALLADAPADLPDATDVILSIIADMDRMEATGENLTLDHFAAWREKARGITAAQRTAAHS